MSWLDALRMPLGAVARQGAAKLNHVLRSEQASWWVGETTDRPPPRGAAHELARRVTHAARRGGQARRCQAEPRPEIGTGFMVGRGNDGSAASSRSRA